MRPAPSPESHIEGLDTGTPRGGLRSLCSPAGVAGGLAELAWIGAHVLMYPLGARTEPLRLDPRIRPGRCPWVCGPCSPTTRWPPAPPSSSCTA